MKYLTTIQASKKWMISSTRITVLAKNGRIPGALQIGYRWMIPDTCEKPFDGRKKEFRKSENSKLYFRYPSFEHRSPDSFIPPLNSEEIQLKDAQEAVYACRFNDAYRLVDGFPDRTNNRYLRINALRILCTCCIYLNDQERFLNYYFRLTDELKKDFPYKTEMQDHIHELNATLGITAYFSDIFHTIPGYQYHETYLPHLAALNTISLYFNNNRKLKSELLKFNELYCSIFDSSSNYSDVQTIHLYLGISYVLLGMRTEADQHLYKALELAEKYELYYGIVSFIYYMEDAFVASLSRFPAEFKKKLLSISDDVHNRYVCFVSNASIHDFFSLISHRDYIYILFAVQGYRNKEIAKLLHVSESTVSKRYNFIFDTLGVKNRAELIRYYNCTATERNFIQ